MLANVKIYIYLFKVPVIACLLEQCHWCQTEGLQLHLYWTMSAGKKIFVMKVRLGDREIEIYCPEQMDAAPESAPESACASTFEYPMKMDKGFLACLDEKKLKNHLIHQLKYRDEDVIKLVLFLTKEY